VQEKALLEGSKLAKQLNDPQASDWYSICANKVKNILNNFYVDNRIISSVYNLEDYSLFRKDDASIVLAYLHTNTEPDTYLENTIIDLINLFRDEYKINKEFDMYLIGRYQGDHFYGGNPWVLLSAAFANMIKKINMLDKTKNFYKDIDKKIYEDLMKISSINKNALSEQIDKNTLEMIGAQFLTWNYSELLSYLLA
jgi:glucoamylase